MELNSATRDPGRVDAGEWVDDIPLMDDLRLKVRGLSSPIVSSLRARKERRVPPDGRERDGSLTHQSSLALLRELLHEVVLLDWANLTIGGRPTPHSADLARQLCTDPQYQPFQDAVIWAASFVDRGRVATQEDYSKNSPQPSGAGSAAEPGPAAT